MNSRALNIALGGLGALLLAVAVASLQWRMQHDAPILMYFGFLMERFDFAPYRDFYDINMPGSYLANMLLGRLFGYGDLGFRCADLLVLGALLWATWRWMRPLGSRVGTCGAILFGLCYLEYGAGMSLQREFLLLLPVALALGVQPQEAGAPLRWMAFGFLFGLAATVKPQSALPCVVLLGVSAIGGRASARDALGCLAGLALPAGLAAVWLERVGALQDFLDMAREFWPLYGQINGDHRVMTGAARLIYLAVNYARFGGWGLWLAPAALGAYMALYQAGLDEARRRHVARLLLLTGLYSVYPLAAGQFWDYHWLPFVYFAVQSASLCLMEQPKAAGAGQRRFPAAVLALAVLLSVHPPREFLDQILGLPLAPPKEGRPDAMAAFLRERLRPGDSVQPLDWTGGALHAMLLAQAQPATPFVADFIFYQNVSHPTIQKLRRRFIAALESAEPRFVLQVTSADKPFVSGPGTTREFPELERLLAAEYAVALRGNGFNVHERKEP